MSVSVTGGYSVSLYAQPTGGSPLTGDALSWGWTNEIAPDVLAEAPVLTQLYVQAETAGTCTPITTTSCVPAHCTQSE